ncbi:hypothetical protein ODZ84_14315 [Chryseobacterium fluminis]|uniref:hypothetical protein n=1 Tax=Chryseobacterium fluminis TaxID=2983606 RepID=UPI002252110E|nr:hypothetical protein [Chryseobacterium sp. MMS21-Ot14]UZT96397.1 hypothetical protein ODZ84_14315 [Chryseobacterium sp. MMS21-Ot14]
MKKLVFAASIFIAFAANAQHRNDDRRYDKVEYHQGPRDFDGLRLTRSQEKQISALSKQRLSPREYDIRLRKILNRSQYAQYQKYGFKKDKRVAINRGFRD